MKQGAPTARKESATSAKLMAAGSQKATGFDSIVFSITGPSQIVRKLIRAVRQAAPIETYLMAAEFKNVQVEDPYMEAIRGDFRVSVGTGAAQSAIDMAISNASNMAAITQSVYGPAANYHPLMAPMYEAMGLNVDEIIPDPANGIDPLHPAGMDMGGMMGQDNLTVQPNVQLSGGAFPGGGTSDTMQEQMNAQA